MTHKSKKIGYWLDFKNGRSSPVRSDDGQFPVYGSNGLIGRCSKPNVKRSATVIGRVGSYCGSTYYSPSAAWVTDNAIIATSKNQEEDRFWFYVLKHLNLNNWRQGSGQPLLNQNILKNITFDAPKYDSRRAIAATLGALDDKIESNNKTQELVEEICWLQFLSLLDSAETTVGTVEQLGKVVGGGTPRKSNTSFYQNDGISWVTPKDLSIQKQKFISKGAIDISEAGYKASGAKLMPAGTVLFSSRAPIGYMGIALNAISTNQGFKSVVPNPQIGTPFTYFSLRRVLPTIEAHAGGSTFKEISGTGMKNIEILMPPTKSIMLFNSWCQGMFDKQISMQEENKVLAKLRDTLLPELMAGRIRVPEAREVIQETTDIQLPEGEND